MSFNMSNQEHAAHLWLLEMLDNRRFQPASEMVPWKPKTIAQMREELKRPPVYGVVHHD